MTRRVLIFLALLALLLPAGPGLAQQNPFSAALTVNGRAISWWELDQRQRLLEALNAPGDAATLAREGLIDDRLRADVADRLGFRLPEDELQAELDDFAARGNLPYDQLLILLEREGVAPETLRDFVRWQATWAAIVRGRFGGQIAITEEEIDRALALARAGSGTSVLLSELVLPLTPQLAEQNRSLAERLSETIDGFDAFAEAARRLSVAPSAADGGRLDWVPLSEFPPEIGSLLVSLAPGEITPPLALPQVIVLFQLRDLRERSVAPPSPSAIDYVEVLIPGTEAAGEIAARLGQRMDRCSDIYGQGRVLGGLPVMRSTRPRGDIPRPVADALARLDPNESATLPATAADGTPALRFVMLCERIFDIGPAEGDAADARQAARQALFGQRIEARAESFLAELRAEARIDEP